MNTTSINQSLDKLTDQINPQLEQAKRQLGRANERVTSFIQEHPTACLAGALLLGYAIAQVARRRN